MFRAITAILVLTFSLQLSANTQDALKLFDAGDYEKSLLAFQALHTKNKQNAHLNYYLARNLYVLGQYEAADELLESNLDMAPNHIDSLYLMGSVKVAQINDASIFKKLGLAEAGLESWKKVVELRPKHHEARYGLANYYMVAPGMAGGDLALAQKEVDLLNDFKPAWGKLVQAQLFDREEKQDDARPLYEAAKNEIKDRSFPQFMWANFLLRQQDYQGALAELQAYENRALTWDDPGALQINIAYGKIYEAMGDSQKAKTHYELALQEAKTKATQKHLKKAIKKLK